MVKCSGPMPSGSCCPRTVNRTGIWPHFVTCVSAVMLRPSAAARPPPSIVTVISTDRILFMFLLSPSDNKLPSCPEGSFKWFRFFFAFRVLPLCPKGFKGAIGKPPYFTEPVMPSANCFCSTKNTMIVGSEQNRTPSISIP